MANRTMDAAGRGLRYPRSAASIYGLALRVLGFYLYLCKKGRIFYFFTFSGFRLSDFFAVCLSIGFAFYLNYWLNLWLVYY